jgi:hypothetical protein
MRFVAEWSGEDVVIAEDGRELGPRINFLVAALDKSSLCLSSSSSSYYYYYYYFQRSSTYIILLPF